MIQKTIGTFALLVAVALILYSLAEVGIYFRSEKLARLEYIWRADIENIELARGFPAAWAEIRTVRKVAADDDKDAANWAKKLSLPIQINPAGGFELKILFISQDSSMGKRQAIIQHQLVEIETGNMVWELGRTYSLD